MRAGERREDQVSSIRLANMNRNFRTRLRYFDNFRHIFEVEPRIDTLREQIHGHGNHIAITCSLAVTKQRSFYPLSACHQAQFRGGNTRAPIIMGMQANDGLFSIRQLTNKIFELIGVDVGRRHFHGRRQIQDDFFVWRGRPHIHYRCADVHCEVHFRRCKTFW